MQVERCMQCMSEVATYPCPHCGFTGETQPEHALPYGTILRGRYLVGKMLGQGGFGITYVGWDLALEQKVAIKEYYPSGHVIRTGATGNVLHWSAAPQAREFRENGVENFLKEARKMARITKVPEATHVNDTFPENGTAYIVMEFVEGSTLKDQLAEKGPMTWEQAKDVFLPAIRAMDAIHQAGIIHRDLSPDNLMLDTDGSVKILDLGAAKDITLNSGASSMVVAKDGFSPPEQYTQRGTSGPWTDVYALAASMYYSLTGIVPPSAIDRIQKDSLLWEHPNLTNLPEGISSAIQKALAADSTARTQSMADFLNELQGASSSSGNTPTDKDPPAAQVPTHHSRSKKKIMIPAVAAIVLLAILASVLTPTVLLPRRNYRQGMAYFEAGDHQSALDAFTKAGDHADSAEKVELCKKWILITDYLKAENTEALLELVENKEQASVYLPLLQSAAENGDALAQYIMGECNHNGYGVAKNEKEALRWYILSADHGQRFAQAELGVYYYDQSNFAEAFSYFHASAAQGYDFAQRRLAFLYYDGEGVEQNYHEALNWFKLSANQGDMIAQFMVGDIYYSGTGIAPDHAEALKWYKRSADQGLSNAQFMLGYMYYFGEGIATNHTKSFNWFKLSAEQGLLLAQRYLAISYYYGEGTDINYKEAYNWYTLAAEQGDDFAQNAIGEMYYFGEGIDQDHSEAMNWFKKAADQGNSFAQRNIGILYLRGHGVAKNHVKAFDWLILSAEQGDANAQYNLGVMYYYGLGVAENKSKYEMWMEYAAEQGYERATRFLESYPNSFLEEFEMRYDIYPFEDIPITVHSPQKTHEDTSGARSAIDDWDKKTGL